MAVREGASGRRRATPGDRAPMDDDGGHGPEADMMTAVVPDDSKPDLGDAPVFGTYDDGGGVGLCRSDWGAVSSQRAHIYSIAVEARAQGWAKVADATEAVAFVSIHTSCP